MENSKLNTIASLEELIKALYNKEVLARYVEQIHELQHQAEQSNEPLLFLAIYKIMARESNSPQWRQAHLWLMRAAKSEIADAQVKKLIIAELGDYFSPYLDWLAKQANKEPTAERLWELAEWYVHPVFLKYKLKQIYNSEKSFELIKQAALINPADIVKKVTEKFTNSFEESKYYFASVFYQLYLVYPDNIVLEDLEIILKFLLKETENQNWKIDYLVSYIKHLSISFLVISDKVCIALAKTAIEYQIIQNQLLTFSLVRNNANNFEFAKILLGAVLLTPKLNINKLAFLAEFTEDEKEIIQVIIDKIQSLNTNINAAPNLPSAISCWNESIKDRNNLLTTELGFKEAFIKKKTIPNLSSVILWQLEYDFNYLIDTTAMISAKNRLDILPVDIVVKLDESTRLLLDFALDSNSKEKLQAIKTRINNLTSKASDVLYFKFAIILRERNSSLLAQEINYVQDCIASYLAAEAKVNSSLNTLTLIKAYYEITLDDTKICELLYVFINKKMRIINSEENETEKDKIELAEALVFLNAISANPKKENEYIARIYNELLMHIDITTDSPSSSLKILFKLATKNKYITSFIIEQLNTDENIHINEALFIYQVLSQQVGSKRWQCAYGWLLSAAEALYSCLQSLPFEEHQDYQALEAYIKRQLAIYFSAYLKSLEEDINSDPQEVNSQKVFELANWYIHPVFYNYGLHTINTVYNIDKSAELYAYAVLLGHKEAFRFLVRCSAVYMHPDHYKVSKAFEFALYKISLENPSLMHPEVGLKYLTSAACRYDDALQQLSLLVYETQKSEHYYDLAFAYSLREDAHASQQAIKFYREAVLQPNATPYVIESSIKRLCEKYHEAQAEVIEELVQKLLNLGRFEAAIAYSKFTKNKVQLQNWLKQASKQLSKQLIDHNLIFDELIHRLDEFKELEKFIQPGYNFNILNGIFDQKSDYYNFAIDFYRALLKCAENNQSSDNNYWLDESIKYLKKIPDFNGVNVITKINSLNLIIKCISNKNFTLLDEECNLLATEICLYPEIKKELLDIYELKSLGQYYHNELIKLLLVIHVITPGITKIEFVSQQLSLNCKKLIIPIIDACNHLNQKLHDAKTSDEKITCWNNSIAWRNEQLEALGFKACLQPKNNNCLDNLSVNLLDSSSQSPETLCVLSDAVQLLILRETKAHQNLGEQENFIKQCSFTLSGKTPIEAAQFFHGMYVLAATKYPHVFTQLDNTDLENLKNNIERLNFFLKKLAASLLNDQKEAISNYYYDLYQIFASYPAYAMQTVTALLHAILYNQQLQSCDIDNYLKQLSTNEHFIALLTVDKFSSHYFVDFKSQILELLATLETFSTAWKEKYRFQLVITGFYRILTQYSSDLSYENKLKNWQKGLIKNSATTPELKNVISVNLIETNWKIESNFAFAGPRSKKTQAIDNLFKSAVRDTEWLKNLYSQSIIWQEEENHSFWQLSARTGAVQKLAYRTAKELLNRYSTNQQTLSAVLDNFINVINNTQDCELNDEHNGKQWDKQGTFGCPTGIKKLRDLAKHREKLGDFRFLWMARHIIEERVKPNLRENPFSIFSQVRRSATTKAFYTGFLEKCNYGKDNFLEELNGFLNIFNDNKSYEISVAPSL